MFYNSTGKKYFTEKPDFMNGVRTPAHPRMHKFIMTLLFCLSTKKKKHIKLYDDRYVSNKILRVHFDLLKKYESLVG
jgi:hypothetical protein